MPKPKKVSGRGMRPRGRASARPRATSRNSAQSFEPLPALQLIYDTAPVGLAFLSPECRYLQVNQRLTEICGISVADHIGRTVRETVPQVADEVEKIVERVVKSGAPVTGVEVCGQRADESNVDRLWVTNWHPLKSGDGTVIGVNVVAEEITARNRASAVITAREEALRESDARFRELADNISQFAWTADEKGWIYWYNKRWHDYTGTTLDEMKGWGWQKVHHPDHVERVVRRIRQSFEDGTPWEDTFPLRGRDGNYRWFLSRALPIRNETGDVIRWFGTNTDVTEQIEAEKALRSLNETLEQRVVAETRERLQVWNVSQELLVVADLEGTYLSVNPAWTTTLGWSESDLVGNSSSWLLHPDDVERARAERQRLATAQIALPIESRYRHRDGSYRWLSWNAAVDGNRIYAMGRDVTELKRAEDDLRGARRELAESARRTTMAAMSASIAHEIKQPLAAIVANAGAGLIWLNRATPQLEEVREVLKNIRTDGHRAAEVIESVRAMFSKTDRPGTPIDANDLIRQTVVIVKGELDAARVIVDLDLSPEPPRLHGHRGQLQQVILNLVTNAADAMRAIRDRARELRIKSELIEADRVAIAVADSGVGIEPKNIDRIFDTFFTTKSKGMGMGLAICRTIVEAHGGTLSVSPGGAHGSVFRIVLPRGNPPAREQAAPDG
jgi:PAS domain S-box-containing protein